MLFGFAFSSLLFASAQAAVPFTSATLTKVENKVNYGERQGDHSMLRAASVQDTIKASSFLLTETDSRAELQYVDGTLVRVGQNTVFTFDAASRTLSLEKGSLLFHFPKGAGGGTVKTPSLTAAITGTAGKVSVDTIAIVEGVVKLVPSGQLVHAGEFARRNPDGTITIAKFDPARALDGKLVYLNRIMPGFPEDVGGFKLTLPDLHQLDQFERAQNQPGSIERYFPPAQSPPPAIRNPNRVTVPPPVNRPNQVPPPNKGGGGNNGGY